jgi:hypothetical protein
MGQSKASTAAVICEAIRQRLRLESEYDGRRRVVEPYVHGTSTRDAESLRAIQVRGPSSSAGYGFGKLWTVAKMIEPRLTGESFVPNDPNYNPNDSGMKTIHCRI